MKWWLKLGLLLVLVIVIAFLGISVYLGYSMTRVTRVPVEQDPALLGLTCEEVSFSSKDEEFTLRALVSRGRKQSTCYCHGA